MDFLSAKRKKEKEKGKNPRRETVGDFSHGEIWGGGLRSVEVDDGGGGCEGGCT